MKTVGEILRLRREQLKLQVKEVASQIKAKEYQIQAIENNNFSCFSSEVFALGYIQDYADIVGLKSEEVVPFFRRMEERGGKKNELIMKNQYSVNEKIGQAEKNIAKIVMVLGTLTILIFFIFFLVSEYRKNILKPMLVIVYPTENIQTKSSSIKIQGKSDKENKLFINEEELALSENGDFSRKMILERGINKFVIKAINRNQKETVIERIVLKK